MADPTTLWEVLNSEFVKSLTGSALGAFAGAWTAQYIAERSKTRDELLKEIRAASAATAMATGITEVFISSKQQLIKPLHDTYYERRAAFIEAAQARRPGERVTVPADLHQLQSIQTPIAHLEEVTLGKMNTPPRATALVGVLGRSIDGYNRSAQTRNEIVEEYREKGFDPFAFYGLQTEGKRDMRYLSTIDALAMYNDDGIHFSKMLADDLAKYAVQLRAKLPRRLQRSLKIIASIDFSKAADVFPDPEKYRDWETMYRAPTPKPRFPWLAPWRKKS